MMHVHVPCHSPWLCSSFGFALIFPLWAPLSPLLLHPMRPLCLSPRSSASVPSCSNCESLHVLNLNCPNLTSLFLQVCLQPTARSGVRLLEGMSQYREARQKRKRKGCTYRVVRA